MSTVVFCLACLVLMYTGFCRMVRTDTTTLLAIRAAFWGLTVAAIVAVGGVLFWGQRPDWPEAMLAVAASLVEIATSRGWATGVPRAFKQQP